MDIIYGTISNSVNILSCIKTSMLDLNIWRKNVLGFKYLIDTVFL